MVVVRESPRTKISPDKNNTQWPPKSPFQALLSSPSGRRKWQDRGTRERERSTSPSPMKNTQRSSRALQAMAGASDDDMDDLDEEERQAQLELAAIEAKLKLERIRQRKKLAAAGEGEAVSSRAASRTDSITTSPRKTLRPSLSQPELRRAQVEVPLSPLKDRFDPAEQLSPARRRLGLNSNALATDVSLKRARDGSQIKKPESVRNEGPRPSFNDRLRATQRRADDQEAKHDRIERVRNTGFDKKLSSFGDVARKVEQNMKISAKVSRAASMRDTRSTPRQAGDALTTSSRSARSSEASGQARPKASGLFRGTAQNSDEKSQNHASDAGINDHGRNDASIDTTSTSSYESFSELHLTKRHIPHVDIARAMEDKEIYTLPRLLKEVTAPSYDPPDCESDWVLFAIIASKSSPYDQKQSHRTSDEGKPQEDALAPRNKFMVLKLCDLKWEVDCFLFGTAFDQFWKLTPGTLLAILNPDIMPPKTNQHSGRFSLKLGSSEDCMMEVGVVRDLGYCNSVKKDGQQCGEWIDKRSTEICEFHLNLFIEKQRKGRMEVNGMWRGTPGSDTDSRNKGRSWEAGGFDKQMKAQQRKGKGSGPGITQSREFGTLYSVNTGSSAADLLDAEDRNQLNGWAEHEASRKRIAAKEEERKLQRMLAKLGDGGDSVGAECLRNKTGLAPKMSLEARALFDKPKAADLGLLDNKASTTHLSPSKERKKHFGLGALTTSGRDAIGWGGARKVESALLKPASTGAKRLASPERGQTRLDVIRPPAIRARSQDDGSVGGSLSSPTKKRARFLLAEKGLREPGRESGGVELRLGEEDDDLDIV